MKRLAIVCVLWWASCALFAQQLFVGSYNIRNQNRYDNERGNAWTVRGKVVCDQIRFEQPDIFGAQEVMVGQLRDMLSMLQGYDYVGVGRDDGKEAGEFEPVFYNTQTLKLLRSGNFWLNETPDIPKLGWDAACIRVCSWGQFKQRHSRFKFYYFNLHMDHIGIVARREAAKLIVQKIREIAKGAPVIVTGDFNVDQTNEIYQTFTQSGILADAYVVAQHRFAENGTFNSFNPLLKTSSRIDHIFLSPNFRVSNYGVLTDGYWTESELSSSTTQKGDAAPQEISFQKYTHRTPSDHYPVLARIRYVK